VGAIAAGAALQSATYWVLSTQRRYSNTQMCLALIRRRYHCRRPTELRRGSIGFAKLQPICLNLNRAASFSVPIRRLGSVCSTHRNRCTAIILEYVDKGTAPSRYSRFICTKSVVLSCIRRYLSEPSSQCSSKRQSLFGSCHHSFIAISCCHPRTLDRIVSFLTGLSELYKHH
jgi:hypothetical protein